MLFFGQCGKKFEHQHTISAFILIKFSSEFAVHIFEYRSGISPKGKYTSSAELLNRRVEGQLLHHIPFLFLDA
jgi:hypothetical protein